MSDDESEETGRAVTPNPQKSRIHAPQKFLPRYQKWSCLTQSKLSYHAFYTLCKYDDISHQGSSDCRHHVDGKRHQNLLVATASTSCGWEKASESTGSYSINIMWMGKGIRSYSINIMWMGKGIRSYSINIMWMGKGIRSYWQLQHQHHVDGKRHQKLLAATASTSCGWEKASEATGSYSINIMWMGKGIRSYWQLQHQPQL
uniref:uncharacterized protein LOC124037513 isoform X2 n=1 Tax=Oncorhynchus gorbuscha TaxID=8017 RepID=UPI001EAF62E1|nr:uncharacterized protein LOC124037513 isoform X2 [Oncorhynchus gorbuscha]